MAKRRITAKAAKPLRDPPQGTTLWNFFGSFWKKLSADKQEQADIHAIEHLTWQQLKGKQQKAQLRLKR